MDESVELKYRKGTKADINAVFQVFVDAIAEMDRNGIPQWDELYPDRDILAEDISKDELFVGTIGGEIACVFVLNSECDEEYEAGEWQYPEASFCVIHRLCVNPKFQNRGVGAYTMKHIEEKLKKEGFESIRFDAFTLNPYALRLYDKLGYAKVGYVNFRKGRFVLMEKKL
ncbi:MAG: GNAT family N-acetyltransferase [Oscillospiraceae bacterium]